MHIFHLANGYFKSGLYALLFSALRQRGIKNTAYVPIDKHETFVQPEDGNITVSPCFYQWDRVLFYSKQRKMLRDIEERGLCEGVDVIHAHTVFSGGYAAYRLHKKYGIPYIVAVRDTDVNTFFKYMIHLRQAGMEIMKNAEKVIFLSPAYKESVFKKYIPEKDRGAIEKKSAVIPNGINQKFFDNRFAARSLSRPTDVRLIYVGDVISRKNVEETIQASRLLREKGYAVSLKIVGAIKEQKYRALIDDCDFVEYHDKCPQEEVISYLRQADIFVMPSHRETFGLAYAEAMSQGLPVLYTRGQGFDEQFPDGAVGYAVDDRSPADVAEKIKLVIEHYAELSRSCVEKVDRFDWSEIAREYKALYETVQKK